MASFTYPDVPMSGADQSHSGGECNGYAGQGFSGNTAAYPELPDTPAYRATDANVAHVNVVLRCLTLSERYDFSLQSLRQAYLSGVTCSMNPDVANQKGLKVAFDASLRETVDQSLKSGFHDFALEMKYRLLSHAIKKDEHKLFESCWNRPSEHSSDDKETLPLLSSIEWTRKSLLELRDGFFRRVQNQLAKGSEDQESFDKSVALTRAMNQCNSCIEGWLEHVQAAGQDPWARNTAKTERQGADRVEPAKTGDMSNIDPALLEEREDAEEEEEEEEEGGARATNTSSQPPRKRQRQTATTTGARQPRHKPGFLDAAPFDTRWEARAVAANAGGGQAATYYYCLLCTNHQGVKHKRDLGRHFQTQHGL